MLSNTLFLAKRGTLNPDKTSTFCWHCSVDEQFEIDKINCYIRIVTADILKEIEDSISSDISVLTEGGSQMLPLMKRDDRPLL